MTQDRRHIHELLQQDLAELKLTQIAANYREVLDEAARKNTSMLEVLASLIASEVTARRERAMVNRMKRAKLPKRKTLEEYKFTFPKRIPKQAILRLFDCEFVAQHRCAILIGPTGTGKSHLLTALGYTACEKGITVRFTRAIDMINTLTTAQVNGTLENALKQYVNPSLLLLDELGYLPIDKRGADLMFQVVAARYESGSIVITTNRPFRDWGKIFDVDNTLATADPPSVCARRSADASRGGARDPRRQLSNERRQRGIRPTAGPRRGPRWSCSSNLQEISWGPSSPFGLASRSCRRCDLTSHSSLLALPSVLWQESAWRDLPSPLRHRAERVTADAYRNVDGDPTRSHLEADDSTKSVSKPTAWQQLEPIIQTPLQNARAERNLTSRTT